MKEREIEVNILTSPIVIRHVEEPSLPLGLGQRISAINKTLANVTRNAQQTHPKHSIRKLPIPLSLIPHKPLESIPNTLVRSLGEIDIRVKSEDVSRRVVSIPVEIDIPYTRCVVLCASKRYTELFLPESYRCRVSPH